MPPNETERSDDPTVVPPDEPLFAAIVPHKLAVGVAFTVLAFALVSLGWIDAALVDGVAVGILCLVFLAGGFAPFNETLGYQLAQAAAFFLWGVARLLVGGVEVVPVILGGAGALGIAVYGRRAVRDGIRAHT
ncbi:hypothetical protein ACH9L7_08190 [Haloferax sp. S1W]|uniref:hypothetical protein n=1 Tax=Haloferax sp. S1W TaxID=3377110 RepID=UPI0037C988F1